MFMQLVFPIQENGQVPPQREILSLHPACLDLPLGTYHVLSLQHLKSWNLKRQQTILI